MLRRMDIRRFWALIEDARDQVSDADDGDAAPTGRAPCWPLCRARRLSPRSGSWGK